MAYVWRRYVEMRPDELAEMVRESPVAYWPLGLIEHHGWHLPIGFDGLKAERLCIRVAERTGGVLLPVMWWGSGGGHAEFAWTHYQDPAAAESVLRTTLGQLARYGFRVAVLIAGHYPWEAILRRVVPDVEREHPSLALLWGTEVSIAKPEVNISGDHAALEETSYGLALLPEFIDLTALGPGHDITAWPEGKPPSEETRRRYTAVCFDPSAPLFAQMGEDARHATAERGEEALAGVIDVVAARVDAMLER